MGNEVEENVEISPRQKAAILLRSFTDETAVKVVDFLTKDERESLIQEIAKMPDYSADDTMDVLNEFLMVFGSVNYGSMSNSIEYIKKLFSGIPQKDLDRLIGRVYYDGENPFSFLNKIKDMEPLLTILDGEEPQTVAIIASYLEPFQAAELLQKLPQEKMVETVYSIAKLDQIDSEVLVKISTLLNKKLEKMAIGDSSTADGIKTVVNILNNVNRSTEKSVFEHLDVMDEELSLEIKENMFTFDDLIKLDALNLQKVVGESDAQVLAKAMKQASEELKEKLFAAMSEGKRETIREDMDALQVKLSDVEKAQQTIANLVKKMEKEEKIQIARGEDDVIL